MNDMVIGGIHRTTGVEPVVGHLFLVIPVHNRCALTRRCLQTLASQDSDNFTVIVVDDGSTDQTSAMLSADFAHVVQLHGDGSLWWTGATRKGIDYALERAIPGDAIVLMNDDLIVEDDFLSTLRRVASKNPNALIGSVVLDINQRHRITDGGTTIDWRTAKFTQLHKGHSIEQFAANQQFAVSALTGRGVLIPVRAFEDIGPYNNRHLPQHGDMELPVRANRAGYSLIVSYASRVYCDHDLAEDVNEQKTYGPADIWKALTKQQSYLNARERFWFAFHTRHNWLQFASFLTCDLARVGYHLASRLSLKSAP